MLKIIGYGFLAFLAFIAFLAVFGPEKEEAEPRTIAGLDVVNMVYEYERYEDGHQNLAFTATVENTSSDTLSLYGFVYGQAETVYPPTRGVYPVGAIQQLSPTRLFRVTNATAGERIQVPPGSEYVMEGIVVIPTHWHNGDRVGSRRFETATVYLYDQEGHRVFEKAFDLD